MQEIAAVFLTLFLSSTLPVLIGCLFPLKVPIPQLWGLGIVVGGLFLALGHLCHLPPVLLVLGVWLAALSGLWRVIQRNRVSSQFVASADSASQKVISLADWAGIFLGIAGLLFLLLTLVLHARAHPVHHWDALKIWWPKSLAISEGRPWEETHMPAYPPLMPCWQWFLSSHVASWETAGRLLTPVAWIMLWIAVGQWVRNWKLFPLVALGAIWCCDIEAATSGLADIFLSTIAGLAILSLLSPRTSTSDSEKPDRDPQRQAGLILAGCCAWIKVEGLVLGVIVLVLQLLMIPREKQRSGSVPLATLFSILILLGWSLILFLKGANPAEVQGGSFSLEGVRLVPVRFAERIPIITRMLWEYGAAWKNLGIAILVLWICRIILWPKGLRTTLFILSIVISQQGFVVLAFLSTQEDVAWHVETAGFRLMSQILPVWMILFIKEYADLIDWGVESRVRLKFGAGDL